MAQIYKNLWFNEEDGTYEFIDSQDRRTVVSQESYILIYILETLQDMKKGEGFTLNNK